MKVLAISVLVCSINSVLSASSDDSNEYCTTASCVHASASILEKINEAINPCDDFYEYACGSFSDELGVPDEKTTIDTLNTITDRVEEYVYTLVDIEDEEEKKKNDTEKNGRLSKRFYNSCQDQDKINQLGREPLKKLLRTLGGWPMLDEGSWDETNWEWDKAMEALKNTYKIVEPVNSEDISENVVGTDDNPLSSDKIDVGIKFFKNFLKEIIKLLKDGGRVDAVALQKDIDDLISFELKLDTYTRQYRKVKKDKTIKIDPQKPFKSAYKKVLWLNFFQGFILSNTTEYEGHVNMSVLDGFSTFFQEVPKRTLANYFATRVTLGSLPFLDSETNQVTLAFEKNIAGKEDFEQRWSFCVASVSEIAPVAIGSLYVDRYVKLRTKQSAEVIMKYVFEAFLENIRTLPWLNEEEREKVLTKSKRILRVVGYIDNLSSEGTTFYQNLTEYNDDQFFETAVSLKAFLAQVKSGLVKLDWTKYAQPHTVNAFYSPNENSIRIMAGIIQDPLFDNDRPAAMNFGSLGGIISHELTHGFDAIFTALGGRKGSFGERIECIMKQYSNYRVPEIEEYNDDGKEFHLRGNQTSKEDIADTGAVKLSYEAFKAWEKDNVLQLKPIGLQKFTYDQIFWLTHAQTFCAFERASLTKSNIENTNYSPHKFRINGPLSNSDHFAKTFNCDSSSNMVSSNKEKCKLW